jgi:hypothetical protein
MKTIFIAYYLFLMCFKATQMCFFSHLNPSVSQIADRDLVSVMEVCFCLRYNDSSYTEYDGG